MNRRQFLTRALAAAPVILVGEQLAELLIPKRTIFLPPRGGWLQSSAYREGDLVLYLAARWKITHIWSPVNYFPGAQTP